MSKRTFRSPRWLHALRLYFITGLVALAPVVITIYILWHLFFTIDGWLSGLYRSVPWLTIRGRPLPGLGIISLILVILLAGVIARHLVGLQLLRATEQQLARIPMVRTIYNAAKQLSQAFLGARRSVFHQVVLVPFPTRGMYAVGFLTARAAPEIRRKVGEETVSVFLPTTPNPTSGYLLTVRREELIPLEMSVEEAVKLVISGGAVIPEDRARSLVERSRGEGEDAHAPSPSGTPRSA